MSLSPSDVLESEQPWDTESWSSQTDNLVPSSSLAVAFSIFLVLFVVILSLLFSIYFNNRRFLVRKL